MRAPKRRRPRKDDRLLGCEPSEFRALAQQVSYVISPEHKNYLTAAGPGRLRSDATACPRELRREQVEAWLKAAMENGDVSAYRDGEFPRYAWAIVDGKAYEARLSNAGLGQYRLPD